MFYIESSSDQTYPEDESDAFMHNIFSKPLYKRIQTAKTTRSLRLASEHSESEGQADEHWPVTQRPARVTHIHNAMSESRLAVSLPHGSHVPTSFCVTRWGSWQPLASVEGGIALFMGWKRYYI